MTESATLSLLRRVAAALGLRLDIGGIRGAHSATVQHVRPSELAGLVATLVAQYEIERAERRRK